MRSFASVAILCLAGSCAAAPAIPPPAPSRTLALRTCNLEAAQPLVGKAADPATLERARELSGARSVRILRPHAPQAMNFNSGRLDVEVDRSGRIARFSCG
ncbi:MAG: I78 family peptidase inhibitor [Sphingomicrobium sp.]